MRVKHAPAAHKTNTRSEPNPDVAAQLREPAKRLLFRHEVCELTRLSDTTIWRLEKVGRFPKRVKIGFKRVAWRAADIDAWIAGQAAGAVA